MRDSHFPSFCATPAGADGVVGAIWLASANTIAITTAKVPIIEVKSPIPRDETIFSSWSAKPEVMWVCMLVTSHERAARPPFFLRVREVPPSI